MVSHPQVEVARSGRCKRRDGLHPRKNVQVDLVIARHATQRPRERPVVGAGAAIGGVSDDVSAERAFYYRKALMRTLASYIGISLDGFYEGPAQEFDFFVVDDEFIQFSAEQLDAAGTLIFGRTTYQGMAEYWPTPDAMRDSPAVAERMNSTPKIVVSSTLTSADWSPTEVVDDAAAGIGTLKTDDGQDLLVLGSPALTANLAHLGLLDELRIMVNPVALGAGKSLFHSMHDRLDLRLLDTHVFSSGNVLLTYRPRHLRPGDGGGA